MTEEYITVDGASPDPHPGRDHVWSEWLPESRKGHYRYCHRPTCFIVQHREATA